MCKPSLFFTLKVHIYFIKNEKHLFTNISIFVILSDMRSKNLKKSRCRVDRQRNLKVREQREKKNLALIAYPWSFGFILLLWLIWIGFSTGRLICFQVPIVFFFCDPEVGILN